jgi:hypothetical protein
VWEVGKAGLDKRGIAEMARAGELQRAAFTGSYVALGAVITGTLSYLLSGEPPEGKDFFYPRTGEMNPDGTPKRLNTPLYNREFASIYSHVKTEGLEAGMTKLVTNKASGVFGLVGSLWTGLDSMGREFRDPNDRLYQKAEQTVQWLFGEEIQPISMEGIRNSDSPVLKALSVAGFGPAPKYAMETEVQGEVKATYHKYNSGKATPYEKAVMSKDASKLRKAYEKDAPEYEQLLTDMIKKYDLTPKEVSKLETRVSNNDSHLFMFNKLTWQQQKRILDKHWHEMSDEDRENYLRVSNRDHMRHNYVPPEEK